MPVILSHSKLINFTVQSAAQQADIVALRLSIAAAASWSVPARHGPTVRAAGWQLGLTDIGPGVLRPHQRLIRPWHTYDTLSQ